MVSSEFSCQTFIRTLDWKKIEEKAGELDTARPPAKELKSTTASGEIGVRGNDSQWETWYSNADHVNRSVSIFTMISTVLSRAIVKQGSNVYNQAQFRIYQSWSNFTSVQKPDYYNQRSILQSREGLEK